MERKYKAFISYRHLPLDASVAKKLHKRIEHYVIPRKLRKNGEKKPGIVFRDQDELPTSSDLSANIRKALDNAEFMIVICSPETQKSRWVITEISYFLEHHDRDHVLAVLADGTPEKSFPPQLTEIPSESGGEPERIEPMAANLVGDGSRDWKRLFGMESLRILAPLIGCAFDDLYRREQRYQLQRIGIATGITATIAATFIGILINRNAKILANYEEALCNQSYYLASESLKLLDKGDRLGAISLAIAALPSESVERPLISRAEFALGCAVNAYTPPGRSNLIATGALHHTGNVTAFQINESGTILCTQTNTGLAAGWDTKSMQKLWEFPLEGDLFSGSCDELCGFLGDDTFLIWTAEYLYSIDCRTGAIHWKQSAPHMLGKRWGSFDKILIAAEARQVVAVTVDTIFCMDADSGIVLASYPAPEITIDQQATEFFSNEYVSPDGKLLAFSFEYGTYGNNQGGIGVMDLTDGSIRTVYSGLSEEDFYLLPQFVFPDSEHLVFSLNVKSAVSWFLFYNMTGYARSTKLLNCLNLNSGEIEWQTTFSFSSPDQEDTLYYIPHAYCTPLLVYAYSNHLACADPNTGQLLGTVDFSSSVIHVEAGDGFLRCILEDGSIGIVYPDDMNSWSTIKWFADSLLHARSAAGSYWTLQRQSSDVVRYERQAEDYAWTPYEIEWSNPKLSKSFYPNHCFSEGNCIAVVDDNVLLVSDGEPGSKLREVELPTDPEDYWGTEYTPLCFRDEILTLRWKDRDQGLLHLNMETLDYEMFTWDNDHLSLNTIYTVKGGEDFYALDYAPTGETDAENKWALYFCTLDRALQIKQKREIETFAEIPEFRVTCNDAKQLFLYVENSETVWRINFQNGQVEAYDDALSELFSRIEHNNGSFEHSICWSADSTLLAAKTALNCLEIYQPNGTFCTRIQGETAEIVSMTFTPDGRQVLTIEKDGDLRRYRVSDGELLGRTELHRTTNYFVPGDVHWQFTDRGFLTIRIDDLLNLVRLDDWNLFSYVLNCCFYLEDMDFFFCIGYEGVEPRLGGFARYSTEDLIQIGERILNGWELSDTKKQEYGLTLP